MLAQAAFIRGRFRHYVRTGPVSQVHDMQSTNGTKSIVNKGSVVLSSSQSIKRITKCYKLASKRRRN